MSRSASWIVRALLINVTAIAAAQQSGEAELACLRPAEGLRVELFASEPLVINPAAIDVDTQGRVWVAEIRYYRKFHEQPPADQIKVLEDTDGDGRADRATVFAEGVYCPMSICVAGPKVFVATSPDLWLYEDRDGDLRADGPPQKLLTGFGGYNHDHGAHSLVLGPDHKWWMSHGDGGFDVRGTDGSHAQFRWGGLLRGELDGSRLETVAVNFRNPYEPGVSSWGEALLSDNDNDGNQSARICWIMPGGNYGWFGGPPHKVPASLPFAESWHFRAHLAGFVPATLVTGFGSPAGMCFYEGAALGNELRDVALHCDPGPREVRAYRHESVGFGQRAQQQVLLTSEGDDYFRPVDVCAAPDGSVLVADWYDGGVGGHAYNNPDQGRIFRLLPAGAKPVRRESPGPYATREEALRGLASPNLATQFLARERLLADGAASVADLTQLARSADDNHLRARALWLLDRLGEEPRGEVLAQLRSPEPRWRELAARILARHGRQYASQLAALVADPSAGVRREVLLAAAAWDDELALPVIQAMARQYDGDDRYLLEALHIAIKGREPKIFARLDGPETWTLSNCRLLALLKPAAAAELLASVLTAEQPDAASQRQAVLQLAVLADRGAAESMLSFVIDARQATAPRLLALELLGANLRDAWQPLKQQQETAERYAALLADAELRDAALSQIAELTWQRQAGAVSRLARDDGAPLAARVKAVETLGALYRHNDSLRDSLNGLTAELIASQQPRLRQTALALAVDLANWTAIEPVLVGAGEDSEEGRALLERLMAGTSGAIFVQKLLLDGRLSIDLTERALQAAATHPDANVRQLIASVLPEDQLPERLGEVVKPEEILALAADAERGRRVFAESSAARCAQCHRVAGQGGTLGPDLSQIGRKYAREALLETILDPSKAIAPEYVSYVVETSSGQLHVGFLTQRSDAEYVLLDAAGKSTRIKTSEVTAVAAQTKSVMPDLVLRDVSAQDAADLLAYLMSLR